MNLKPAVCVLLAQEVPLCLIDMSDSFVERLSKAWGPLTRSFLILLMTYASLSRFDR